MKIALKMISLLVIFLLSACGDGPPNAAFFNADKDCKDFVTQEQAQAYFESLGGSPANNVDRLDGNDRDGIVCESNPSVFNLPAQQDTRIQISLRQFSGNVISIVDGDTIKVVDSLGIITIRLSEIDCPEKNQAFGSDATQFTSNLALGKTVSLNVSDIDQYGRLIATVLLPDGQNLNRELIRAGLAWWYSRFSNDLSLRDLEMAARAAKIGLWQDNNPIPPWVFR